MTCDTCYAVPCDPEVHTATRRVRAAFRAEIKRLTKPYQRAAPKKNVKSDRFVRGKAQ